MYHGVTEKKNLKFNARHISKKTLEKHLKYFKKNFNVVKISEIFEMYRQNKIPDKKIIAITFDDGFENNFNIVLPLLKKYNLPATFFISAICIENDNEVLWPDVINILRQNIENNLIVGKNIFVKHDKYDFYCFEKNISLLEYLKQQTVKTGTAIIDELKQKNNFCEILKSVNPEIWKLMSKEQIAELSKSELIEIASHGYTHFNLANIEKDEAYNEIKKSKELLEELIQKKIISIAFPNGSYNKEINEMCLSSGYKNLCAVNYRQKEDADDKNILPRYGLSFEENYFANIFHIYKAFEDKGF